MQRKIPPHNQPDPPGCPAGGVGCPGTAQSGTAQSTVSLTTFGQLAVEDDELAASGDFEWGEFAFVSVRGCVRENNEDRAGAWVPDSGNAGQGETGSPLFVVADGLGGHEGGEMASLTAVDTAVANWAIGPRDRPRQRLRAIARAANAEVYGAAVVTGNYGMATTFTALSFDAEEALVAHVGDSRAYLVRDGEARQMTTDHSQVADMIRIGLITPEQAASHPARSVLTRCLGMNPGITVDLAREKVRDGDVIALCTDGLWSVVARHEIAETAGMAMHSGHLRGGAGLPGGASREGLGSTALEQACEVLVRKAIQRGAPDNVTILLVAVVSRPAGLGTSVTSGSIPRGSTAGDGVDMQASRRDQECGWGDPGRKPRWRRSLPGRYRRS